MIFAKTLATDRPDEIAIRELVGRLSRDVSLRQGDQQEIPGKSIEPFVLLTGGAAPILSPHLPCARWEPHLALQGLAIVAEHFPP